MNRQRIIACGVPRSGSTLVWQVLLRALPKYLVIKAHPASWTPIDDFQLIVGCIRNPYDAAGSCFRARIVGDYGDGSQDTVKGTKDGLRAELQMLHNNFRITRELMTRFPKRFVLLRYEEFWQDFNVIFSMVEERLGERILPARRDVICRECSFDTNRQRSFAPLEDRNYSRTKINTSHTAVGYLGMWQAIIPLWGYDLMDQFCKPLCEEWGYADQ